MDDVLRQNRLLARLPVSEVAELSAHLEAVDVPGATSSEARTTRLCGSISP